MSKNLNIIIIIIITLLLIFVPILLKRLTWKKLIKQLNDEDYNAFFHTLDTTVCKLSYSAFNREYMRLSAYLAMRDDNQIETQLDLLKNMRISNKQKASVGSRGFYYYLEKGKIKKAEGMLTYSKGYADEKTYHNMEIQYSILLKKESKYIDDVKSILNSMWDGTSKLDPDKKYAVGTLQYLIGLQYSYINDVDHMMEYFNPALENLVNTPYAEDIQNIMDKKHLS